MHFSGHAGGCLGLGSLSHYCIMSGQKDWLNTWSCRNVKKWKGLKTGNIHFALSSSSHSFCVYFEIISMLCSSEISLCFSILVSRLRFTVTQSFLSLSFSGALIVEYFYQRELKSHSTLVEWGIFWEGKNTNSLLKGIRSQIGPMFKPSTLRLTLVINYSA